jgi:ATP-dependent DNA ligase
MMNSGVEKLALKYPNGIPLKVVAFSILMLEGKDISTLPYDTKYNVLKQFFPSAGFMGEKLKGRELIYRTEMKCCRQLGINNLIDAEEYVRNEDFYHEGLVIFDGGSMKSIKVKRQQTADFVVIGYDWTSTGKYANNGWIKSIEFGLLSSSVKTKGKNSLTQVEVEAMINGDKLKSIGFVSGMDETVRADVSNRPYEYIGKVAEVEFMDWTGNALRHSRFKGWRTDKDINRCNFDQLN